MTKEDPGLEPTRSARRQISQEFDHDPAKVVQHYVEFQKRFGHRLQQGPRVEPAEAKTTEPGVVSDSPDPT